MGPIPLIRKLTPGVTLSTKMFYLIWDEPPSTMGPKKKKKVMKCLPNMVEFITMGFNSDQSLSHVRLCDSMDCSMPGLSVHHQLPKFIQTHVH